MTPSRSNSAQEGPSRLLVALALHGPLLAVAWDVPASSFPELAMVLLVVAVAPIVAWALAPGLRNSRRSLAVYGMVPLCTLLASAAVETTLAEPHGSGRVLRVAVGMAALLAAVQLATVPPPDAPATPQPSRTSAKGLARRRRLRHALVFVTLAALTAVVTVAPFVEASSTRFERMFAVVVAATLGATAILSVLPRAMRRERRAPRRSAAAFAWLTLAAVLLAAGHFLR